MVGDEAADDYLTDGAPAGDESDEEADEGGPGDPPRPVEDRPPVHVHGVCVVVVGPLLGAGDRVRLADAPLRRLRDDRLGALRDRVWRRRDAAAPEDRALVL